MASLRKKCPYSVRMRENTDHKNSEYEHFSRSVCLSLTYVEKNTINI